MCAICYSILRNNTLLLSVGRSAASPHLRQEIHVGGTGLRKTALQGSEDINIR